MKVEKSWLGDFYEKANRSDYAKRELWDLLIDYDYIEDVPGMRVGGSPFWPGEVEGEDHPVIEIYDGPPDRERLHTILTKRLARAGFAIKGWSFQESTNGWHLKIRLDPHPAPVESVALQAVCGSDPLRESCNIQRAREVERWARETLEGGTDGAREAVEFWRTRWNVLYQPKPEREATP